MFFFVEETMLMLFMLFCVPALVYALEKLTRRNLIHRVFTILIFLVIFDVYFEQTEKLIKNRADVIVEQEKVSPEHRRGMNQWQGNRCSR